MPPNKFSLNERVYIYKTYLKSRKSCAKTRRKFRNKFPNRPVPTANTIKNLSTKFNETGSVNNKKIVRRRHVLTEEKLDQIGERLEHTPQKSLNRLAQETGISKSSARTAAKLLKLKPYKIPVVQELRQTDPDRRVRFCNWVLEKVDSGEIDPKLLFFSDEALFHLNGHVCSQNNRYYSNEKPDIVIQTPLHGEKIGVWCAINGHRIVGPFFF